MKFANTIIRKLTNEPQNELHNEEQGAITVDWWDDNCSSNGGGVGGDCDCDCDFDDDDDTSN